MTQRLSGLDDVSGGGYEPPDVQVAAGDGYAVELVNVAARVWRVGVGAPQPVEAERLGTLFASGGDRLTDPRIVFDAPSGRFFASISDVDASTIRLAVSATGDPTGRWIVASISTGGCADQPRLGPADNVVVVAADIFRDCDSTGSRPLGAQLWVLNKEDLLTGSTSPSLASFGPDAKYTTLAPAQALTKTAIDYVVSLDRPISRVVHVLEVSGVPPDPVAVREVATPSLPLLTRPPFAAQPSLASGRVAPGIETNDNRVLDAVWQDGRLWFSANDACVPAGDVLLRACARVVELATPAMTVTSATDVSQPGAGVFYPALRPTANGDLVVVYGASGLAVNPETVVFVRTKDGTTTAPVVVARSGGAYLGDRYGDYFGAAQDPEDPNVVWVAGEVGPDVAGGHGWRTTVAAVTVTQAGGTPPLAVVQAPPGMHAVAAVARAGSAVKLRFRPLDDGADVRTVLTVRSRAKQLVFDRTTETGDVRAGQTYSVRWLPAKKLHGTFAYCVRAVAVDGSASAPSCATVRLR